METTKIALFKNKKIRKILHDNQWWFSVVDVIEALTESVDPRDVQQIQLIWYYRRKLFNHSSKS